MAADPKLHGIFTVRGKQGVPEHAPFSLYITSDEKFEEATKKGGIDNLRRYLLDNNPDTDRQDKERRNRVVSLDYELRPQDEYNSIHAWSQVPTAEETAQLNTHIARYQTLVAELEAEQSSGDGELSAAKQVLLRDYKVNLGQLRQLYIFSGTGTLGYLQEIPSVFGYGGKCLYDFNGAANIHKIRRSNFALDPDRPFHMAFRFAHPHEDQRQDARKMRWGPFVLELRDGRSAYLTMYAKEYYQNGTEPDLVKIQAEQTRLDELLDEGRLTIADMLYIEERETLKRQLEIEVKLAKIERDSPAYLPYYNQIQRATAEINARRDFKRHLPGETAREIELIKKRLFAIYEQNINLQESSENFYGDAGIVRLTVLPQQRGFLSFTLTNGQPVTVDLPDIIETRKYGRLWNKTRIVLESNGGAGEWQFLYPNVNSRGEYRLPDVLLPFALGEDELVYWQGDWQNDGRSVVAKDGLRYFLNASTPGVGIAFRVARSASWSEEQPRYDFSAILRSDLGKKEDPSNTKDIRNAYLPWLYSLQIFINAGALPEPGEEVWTSTAFGTTLSTTSGYPNPNRDNPILNVVVNCDELSSSKRGTNFIIDIHDPNGTANFKAYEEHWCDFRCGLWLPDSNFVTGVLPYYLSCVIKEAVLMNAKELGLAPEQYVNPYGVDSYWSLRVEDIWSVIEEYRLNCDVILDGLTLGAALRLLLGMPGFGNAQLAGINATGNLAGQRIDPPGAGEKPKRVGKCGNKLSSLVVGLMDDFGMTDDFKELRLHFEHGIFTLDAPSDIVVASHESAGDGPGHLMIRDGAQVVRDWKRFYNYFEVHGKRDRKTGEPIKAVYPIFESFLPGYEDHPLHIGHEKRFDLILRPDLDNKAACERAVQVAAVRNAKSGKMDVWETSWFYPPRYVGDMIETDDKTVEMARISGLSLKGITKAGVVTRPRVPLP